MLKNFFRVALLAVAAVCALALCVDNTADYDALRPTLLGGVYFYSDHDGVDAFDAQIKSEALSKLEGYKYNPQNETCGTSQTKRTPTHPAEKKRSVTFSGNIPRAFGNHPNALLASVK